MPYTQQIIVTEAHIDGLHHVNNVQYLYWVQEIAKAHWNHLIKENDAIEGVWVVRNHFITYKRPAFLGDRLRIETYVKSIRGPLSERVVTILNHQRNEILVECTTQWCYMNLDSRKPLKISDAIKNLLVAEH
jgi:acyl-CoA thioester hydrolase